MQMRFWIINEYQADKNMKTQRDDLYRTSSGASRTSHGSSTASDDVELGKILGETSYDSDTTIEVPDKDKKKERKVSFNTSETSSVKSIIPPSNPQSQKKKTGIPERSKVAFYKAGMVAFIAATFIVLMCAIFFCVYHYSPCRKGGHWSKSLDQCKVTPIPSECLDCKDDPTNVFCTDDYRRCTRAEMAKYIQYNGAATAVLLKATAICMSSFMCLLMISTVFMDLSGGKMSKDEIRVGNGWTVSINVLYFLAYIIVYGFYGIIYGFNTSLIGRNTPFDNGVFLEVMMWIGFAADLLNSYILVCMIGFKRCDLDGLV